MFGEIIQHASTRYWFYSFHLTWKVFLSTWQLCFERKVSFLSFPRCEICSKQVNTFASLNLHMKRLHSGPKEVQLKTFACQYCIKVFGTKGHLKEHILGVHDQSRSGIEIIDIFKGRSKWRLWILILLTLPYITLTEILYTTPIILFPFAILQQFVSYYFWVKC